MREREIRIVLQRLVKRARGLDPDKRMQVDEPLIVKRLRLTRFRAGIIMRLADAGANRHRSLEQGLWNRGDDVRGVLRRK